MRVFVTGGAGYIGSICVEELLDADHEVTVYDNLTEGHATAVDHRAVFIPARLSDEASIAQAIQEAKAEVIIHFAGNCLVGESAMNPGKYFRNNVANGIHLLNAANIAGVKKFIFSSSCAVYGLPERLPITEDTAPHPINPYGESKWVLEKLLRWYHEIHGMEYVALRYFNAAGASDHYGEHHRVETHLIPNVLKVALGKAPHCEIYGTDYPTPDGTCIRDYIHVVDLAQAHILAMAPDKCGAYNLGTGTGYSVREVIQTCETVAGTRIKCMEKPRRPGDPPRLVACAEKARRELGWEPQYPGLEEIIRSAWEWHKTHPDGYTD